MRWVSTLALFCLASFNSILAHAEDANAQDEHYRLDRSETEQRFGVDAFIELGNFSRESVHFQGYGLGVNGRYGLTDHVAVEIAMSQTYSFSGGVSALYTRLQSDIAFALSGDFVGRGETVSLDGEKTLETKASQKNLFGLIVGAQQIFFNGTSSVTPGSGLVIGGLGDVRVLGTCLSLKAETGLLLVNGKSVSLFIANIGIHFPK